MCGVIMCCDKRSLQEKAIFIEAGQHLLNALQHKKTYKVLHPCTVDKVLDALVVLHTNYFEKRDRAGADVDNLNVSDTDTFRHNNPMNALVYDAFGFIINWIKYNDEVVQKKKGPDTAASNHIRTITPHFLRKMAPCMDSATLLTHIENLGMTVEDPSLLFDVISKRFKSSTHANTRMDELLEFAEKESDPNKLQDVHAQIKHQEIILDDESRSADRLRCTFGKLGYTVLSHESWNSDEGIECFTNLVSLLTRPLQSDKIKRKLANWQLALTLIVSNSQQIEEGRGLASLHYFTDWSTGILPLLHRLAHSDLQPHDKALTAKEIDDCIDANVPRGIVSPVRMKDQQLDLHSFFQCLAAREDFPYDNPRVWGACLNAAVATSSLVAAEELAYSIITHFDSWAVHEGRRNMMAVNALVKKTRNPHHLRILFNKLTGGVMDAAPLVSKDAYSDAFDYFIHAEMWEEAVEVLWNESWVPEQTLLFEVLMTGVFDEDFGDLDTNCNPLQILRHYFEKVNRIKQIPDRTTAEILMRCFYKTEDKERHTSHDTHGIRPVHSSSDGRAIDGADCKKYLFDSFTPYVLKESINLKQALKIRGILTNSKPVVVGRLAHEADVLFMCGVIMCCDKRSLQEKAIFIEAGQHLLKALENETTYKVLHPCTVDKVLDALVVLHTNRFEKRDRAGADVDNLNVSDTDTFMDNFMNMTVSTAFGFIINWLQTALLEVKQKGPDTTASNHIHTITPHFLRKMAPCMDSATLLTHIENLGMTVEDPSLLFDVISKRFKSSTHANTRMDELLELEEKESDPNKLQAVEEQIKNQEIILLQENTWTDKLRHTFGKLGYKVLSHESWNSDEGIECFTNLVSLLTRPRQSDMVEEKLANWQVALTLIVSNSQQIKEGCGLASLHYFTDWSTGILPLLQRLAQCDFRLYNKALTAKEIDDCIDANVPRVIVSPVRMKDQQLDLHSFFQCLAAREDFPYDNPRVWGACLNAAVATSSLVAAEELAYSIITHFDSWAVHEGRRNMMAVNALVKKTRNPHHLRILFNKLTGGVMDAAPLVSKDAYSDAFDYFIHAEMWEEAVEVLWNEGCAHEAAVVSDAVLLKVVYCMCNVVYLTGSSDTPDKALNLLKSRMYFMAEIIGINNSYLNTAVSTDTD